MIGAACLACLICAAACSRAGADYPYAAHRVDEESLAAAARPGPLPAATRDAALPGAAAPAAPAGAAAKDAAPRIAFPIAGTVSHHLLASGCIDEYFAKLASRREVSTFVILSPRHFPVGSSRIAFTGLDWEVGPRRVRADRALADRLRRAVGAAGADGTAAAGGAAWDPWSFHGEHGVSALIPFVAKHFPRARVVPIVLEIEGRDSEALARLGAALAAESIRDTGIFVLASVDFSHHGEAGITAERDARSRAALLGFSELTASRIYSDNPPGFNALCELVSRAGRGEAEILRHATAQDFADEREDITSYFFCFF